MPTFSRWKGILFLTGLAVLSGCGSSTGSRSNSSIYGGGMMTSSYPGYLGRFDVLWAERTVLLTSDRPGSGMPFLPGAGSPDRGGGSGFPVSVRATLMDSAVISAGIEEFSKISSMIPEEVVQFRRSYERTFSAGDSIFVWVEMQTTSTEEFLQLDRWTMFLENGDGRQVEPGRIVQHPLRRLRISPVPGREGEPQATEEESRVWEPVAKDVELYFPIVPGFVQRSGLSHAERLRFVILDARNPAIRAEGEWRPSHGNE